MKLSGKRKVNKMTIGIIVIIVILVIVAALFLLKKHGDRHILDGPGMINHRAWDLVGVSYSCSGGMEGGYHFMDILPDETPLFRKIEAIVREDVDRERRFVQVRPHFKRKRKRKRAFCCGCCPCRRICLPGQGNAAWRAVSGIRPGRPCRRSLSMVCRHSIICWSAMRIMILIGRPGCPMPVPMDGCL